MNKNNKTSTKNAIMSGKNIYKDKRQYNCICKKYMYSDCKIYAVPIKTNIKSSKKTVLKTNFIYIYQYS